MSICFVLSYLQRLLRDACINDEGLFSAFLNRLFNTLSWTMTEFSISIRDMQEKYQVCMVYILIPYAVEITFLYIIVFIVIFYLF